MKSTERTIAFVAILMSFVAATFAVPASANSGGEHIYPGVTYYGEIPCSDEIPAPDNDTYLFSLTSPCEVSIFVEDYPEYGDRYEVWVDGNYIGTTPTVPCWPEPGGPSSATFTVSLSAGDHTLQLKNTLEPCFQGDPPCYPINSDNMLPSGFYFSYSIPSQVSSFTPVGLVALFSLLAAIAAVAIVRKRR